MLRIVGDENGLKRRDFLTIGSALGLGLGSLGLPRTAAASGSSATKNGVTGRSVIFLFQQGGPSQHETFDPKVDAPREIRSVAGSIPTSVPGVHFGSHMERLSKLAHHLTILRSFQTNNAGHNIQPIVGRDSRDTNIGVHFSRVVGATDPVTGCPTNSILYPAAVDPDVPGPQARGNLASTGDYGSGLKPFTPGKGGQLQADMELRLPEERLGDRKTLLARLDRLRREIDSSGQLEGVEDLRDQAYELLLGGGVSAALDLSREDPRVFKKYDTSHFVRPGRWDKVNRGRKRYYNSQAGTIGKLLLMARRLCEVGCGFVTIHAGYAGVWDMHADGNNLNMRDGMEAVGRPFDHAVAAFVEDLEERGLSDKILLVCLGEMGRTPKYNKRGGRDHWAKLAPLLLYGGGLEGGRVIGRSDKIGGEPATQNYGPRHLISTLLRTLVEPGELRLAADAPREVLELMAHDPLPV